MASPPPVFPTAIRSPLPPIHPDPALRPSGPPALRPSIPPPYKPLINPLIHKYCCRSGIIWVKITIEYPSQPSFGTR